MGVGLTAACAGPAPPSPKVAVEASTLARAEALMENPLLHKSALPYHLPPFDRIEVAHFEPAFERGMREHLEEVERIARNPARPSFDNTILALERADELLRRTSAVFFNLVHSNTNPSLEELQERVAPKLAAHSDALYLNEPLFARVEQLFEQREALGLDKESAQLLDRYHTAFVRAGARLPEADKEKLRELNERLASLTNQYQQAVLRGVNASAITVSDVAELDGLSDEQLAIAADSARERGLKGQYLIALVNTTTQPVLAQLKNRALRRRLFEASTRRGLPGGAAGKYSTLGLVADIVRLRAERAALLGFDSHAAFVLEDETAKTPRAVNEMLERLVPAAVANARREAAELQKLIDQDAKVSEQKPFQLQAWDWDFYAERLRKARFDYDEAEVRPYLELNNVLENGVLYAAEKLYGLSFKPRSDLPVYHPDVQIFEVFDQSGRVGLCLFDWYARENKRGGAWMNDFVKQSALLNEKPVVVTNLNVQKAPAGQPTLMTFDEVTTAFHEFGHALHGLLSRVRYPTLSGTSVPTDFVEYPSQFNEMWAMDADVLEHYARHMRTGQVMPKALMEKVVAARKFNQGYATTEYLAAALLDQAYHQLSPDSTPAAQEVEAFEAAALARAKIQLEVVPPRYRSGYFSHIFSDPVGYSAGYYSYVWAEVLARDSERWFKQHGGLARENGDRFRSRVLGRGFTRDPLEMFESFKGGQPDVQPLLEARGLDSGAP